MPRPSPAATCCWSASGRSTSRTRRWSTRPSGRWARSFRARVDVTEWLGNEQYAYIPYEAPPEITEQLRALSRELDAEELRTQAIVSIDAASRIREGREAEFWLDSRKVHVFDPKSGENLTRDAEAGAALTRMAEEDREEQLAESTGGPAGPGTGPRGTPEARGGAHAAGAA